MKDLIFHAPINDTSIGNVSVAFLREAYELDLNISLFPVSDSIDLSVYDSLNEDFKNWLNFSFENRFKKLSKNTPSFQVWHINGSEKKISNKNFLYTFHETSRATISELNICKLHEKVFFSSLYSKNIFKSAGLENCDSAPLGLDRDFFISTRKFNNSIKHFGLMGKLEKRKNTKQILKCWAEEFGNNPDFQLSCIIVNRFLPNDKLNKEIGEALGGNQYSNINFLPFLPKNSDVNQFINSIDIDLTGLSGGEGWNLPSFNATCIGKWSCVSNCTSHKDWANEENSILIEPNGIFDADDGIFFKNGSGFNQGYFHSLSDESIKNAFHQALSKDCINQEGVKLSNKFSYKKTLTYLLDNIL